MSTPYLPTTAVKMFGFIFGLLLTLRMKETFQAAIDEGYCDKSDTTCPIGEYCDIDGQFCRLCGDICYGINPHETAIVDLCKEKCYDVYQQVFEQKDTTVLETNFVTETNKIPQALKSDELYTSSDLARDGLAAACVLLLMITVIVAVLGLRYLCRRSRSREAASGSKSESGPAARAGSQYSLGTAIQVTYMPF